MQTQTSTPVLVAKIAKPHGLQGEVVLDSLTDVEGRLEDQPVFLLMAGEMVERALKVESRRFFGGRHVIKFEEVNNRDDADALRGKDLAIPEEDLGELPDDMYYIHDLVGMRVLLKDGSEIGTVQRVMTTGGVDVLEIGEGGKILIPFAESICVEVDLEKRQITIDPPEGLLQLNAR